MSDTSKKSQPKTIQATPEFLEKLAIQEHKKLKAQKLSESKEVVVENVFDSIFSSKPETVVEGVEQPKKETPALLAESISISFKDELLSDSFMNRKK